MYKLTKFFWVGLITASVGCVAVSSSIGNHVEQNLGVSLLYKLRGPITPPPNVAMVYIDGNSATQLGLKGELKDWPRSVHACILKRLKAAGASVVVFDIAFLEPRPEAIHPEGICSEITSDSNADDAFIKEVEDSGDVILLEKIEQKNYWAHDQVLQTTLSTKPFNKLSEAAVATGPFVLPVSTQRLDNFLSFLCHSEQIDNEGKCRKKTTTLPMLALQHYNTDKTKNQKSIEVDTTSYSKRLNFYGPPRTIPCRSYQSILSTAFKGESCSDVDFAGKVVFIGVTKYGSPAQTDSYYTVYSGNDGINLAGVEVLATAFANLLTDTSLKNSRITFELLTVCLFGMALGSLVRVFSPLAKVWLSVIISFIYLVAAYIAFTKYYLVLPVVTPLLVQTPVAILVASFIHYQYERLRREVLQRITGAYITESEIDQTTKITNPTGLVYGVCLATDMEGSTALVEKLGSKKFEKLIHSYYENIARIIKQNDGLLLDIAGDGTMSTWQINEQELPNARTKACTAAMEILAVDERLTASLNCPIQTRIGLHAGEFTLNFTRIGDRYFYKGTGNTLNIASHIEQLNKKLKTRVLTSESAAGSDDQLSLKHHGSFVIGGLNKKIKILEIVKVNQVIELS